MRNFQKSIMSKLSTTTIRFTGPLTHWTFILLIILAVTPSLNSQEFLKTPTINIYKCKGSTLSSGYEIRVPSYAFYSHVVLRIHNTQTFPGCRASPLMTETELFYLHTNESHSVEISSKVINEIESSKTSISPGGILNVKNRYYNFREFCISSYRPPFQSAQPLLKLNYCPVNCSSSIQSRQLCIRKCCPVGKAVDLGKHREYRCKPSGNKSWTGFLYDEDSWNDRISKEDGDQKLEKLHYFKEDMKIACNGSHQHVWLGRKLLDHVPAMTKMLTNGQLLYISAHRKWTHLNTKGFCMDGIQNFGENRFYSGKETDQVLFLCVERDVKPENKQTVLYMYSLFVASGFYFTTAMIYLLLWDKQNTHGWTVFSLVLSQFFMCLFVGNAHKLGLYGKEGTRQSLLCVTNAVMGHFFMLATFTWLTVINFDLWSAFRSFKPRYHKSMDFKKFFLYSVFGWGVPLIVVILGVVLDNIFPDRESLVLVPQYGSNICYVAEWAQGPYVYYLMAIFLGVTLVLSISTCTKIYKFHADTADARSSSNAGDRKIFRLYAKLSVVLGTSWIFELISWAASDEDDHQHWVWIILDMYNLLTALFIFIIFACKRSNWTLLVEKYPCLKPITDLFDKLKARKQSDQSATTGLTLPSVRGPRDELGRS